MISSENFKETCDIIIDPHYQPNCVINTKTPKRVFITGELNIFDRCLHILQSFESKYELVYHRTDDTFDRYKFESIKPYVSKIYAQNCDISSNMITKIPLGFPDGKYPPESQYCDNKDILCYVNLGTYNNELKFRKCTSIRDHCKTILHEKEFITIDEPTLTNKEFNKKLRRCKFVVCPFGFGLDTHRFYETYYARATPIVLTSGLDELHSKFGALIVNDWNEITEELLANFNNDTYKPELLEVSTYISDQQ